MRWRQAWLSLPNGPQHELVPPLLPQRPPTSARARPIMSTSSSELLLQSWLPPQQAPSKTNTHRGRVAAHLPVSLCIFLRRNCTDRPCLRPWVSSSGCMLIGGWLAVCIRKKRCAARLGDSVLCLQQRPTQVPHDSWQQTLCKQGVPFWGAAACMCTCTAFWHCCASI